MTITEYKIYLQNWHRVQSYRGIQISTYCTIKEDNRKKSGFHVRNIPELLKRQVLKRCMVICLIDEAIKTGL